MRKNALIVLVIAVLMSTQMCAYALSGEKDEYIFLYPDFPYRKPVSIALLPFSDDTGDEDLAWLSNGIPENCISKFARSESIRLVDRQMIGEIMRELGFSNSDLADPANALEVGRGVAAKVIVCGSYQKRPNNIVKIMWRFTDAETGTVVKADEETGSRKNIESLMERLGREMVMAIDPDMNFSPMREPKSRREAALKSMAWPGWGDLPERKVSGIVMGAIQLTALAVLAASEFSYRNNLQEYEDAREKYGNPENFSTYSEYKDQRELMISEREKALDSKHLRNVMLFSAIVGVRLIGALESGIFTPVAGSEKYSFAATTTGGMAVLSWGFRF
jgi:TolB-like protein